MLYCTSKNLAQKTLKSYEQSLKLFALYFEDEFDITEVEMEIQKNPCKQIENPKPERKKKKLLQERQIGNVLSQFDVTTFHGYRNYMISKSLLDTCVWQNENVRCGN